jgi:hypothetical protein
VDERSEVELVFLLGHQAVLLKTHIGGDSLSNERQYLVTLSPA